MSRQKRRRTTLKERLTPCECCGYPLSQRHHLLPIEYYYENEETVSVCANCHEAIHFLEKAFSDLEYGAENTHSRKVMAHLLNTWGVESDRVKTMTDIINRSKVLKSKKFPEKSLLNYRLMRAILG